MAFNTPFKMWKRYEFNGGTRDPCIISWPSGMKARGEVRDQLLPRDRPRSHDPRHARDRAAETIKGHTQNHFDGVSMRDSFDDAAAESKRRTQFYAMLGSRVDLARGWKAVTTHPCPRGLGRLQRGTSGELYHTDVDRAENTNLAAEQPRRSERW